jgi:hypothetical protein
MGKGVVAGAGDFLGAIPQAFKTAYDQNISPVKALVDPIAGQVRDFAKAGVENQEHPEASASGNVLNFAENLPLVGGYVKQVEAGSKPTMTAPASADGGYQANYASPEAIGAGMRAATALAIAPKVAGETLGAAGDAGKTIGAAGKAVRNVATDALESYRTAPQRAAMPVETAGMPSKAILGSERLYQAAAPVGSDPQFRENLYAVHKDLAEIGRKIGPQLEDAKGGTVSPDMAARVTVNGINDHLSDMYKEERAPQIARNATAAVVPNFGEDAQGGLEYISKNAGTAADRALATKALTAESMPLADVDELARATNRALSPLRGMTPQELALAEGGSRRMGGLQALDSSLSESIAKELSNRGEGGIKEYERTYAGLSQVRDQIQSRMNAAELNQPGVIKGAIKPIVSTLTGTPSGIASASQAAVADVKMGEMLRNGFKNLADSGVSRVRATGPGAPPIKGLLTNGSIQIPSSMEARPNNPQMPPTEYTTTAQRKGLLLPESAGGMIPLPSSNPEEFMQGRDIPDSELRELPPQQIIDYMRKRYLRQQSGGK